MTRYLSSFDDGAVDRIPDEDEPAMGNASHRVVNEAKDTGVCVHRRTEDAACRCAIEAREREASSGDPLSSW